MKLYKKFFSRWTGVAMLATMGLFACQPELDEPTLTSGSADFSTYVALGNSLTSGYSDGALYREGQENSYPVMLAMSMDKVGGINGEFKTPLVPAGNGSGGASGKLVLTAESFPLPVPTANDLSTFASVTAGGPYQNLGVPGARVGNLTQVGYGSSQGNPFYARFAANPLATLAGEAKAQNPTFFTLWIGNNDVLGYATSGGDEGGDMITPVAEFRESFNRIMSELDGASGGAIANIPDILGAAYFSAVPYNNFEIDQATADQVNAGVTATIKGSVRQQVEASRPLIVQQVTAGVREGAKQQALAGGATEAQANGIADAYIASAEGMAVIAATVETTIDETVESSFQAIPAQFRPTVSAGVNPFILQSAPSATNPTGLRLATPDDLISLTAGAYASSAAFLALPVLPESFVLDVEEQAKVTAAIDSYNAIIKEAAGSKYAHVDVHGFFNRVTAGGYINQGVGYDARFVLGGAFSLDGIHLTQRGYALAGNEFIKAINTKYNSKLPWIDVNSYEGIVYP